MTQNAFRFECRTTHENPWNHVKPVPLVASVALFLENKSNNIKQLFNILNFQSLCHYAGKTGKTGTVVSSRYLLLAGLDHTKARQGELSRFLHFLCSNLSQKVQDLISHFTCFHLHILHANDLWRFFFVLLPYFPNICRKKQHVTLSQLQYCPVAFVVSPFFKPAASANSAARAPLVITFTDLAIAFIGAIALVKGVLLEMRSWSVKGDWSQTATKNAQNVEVWINSSSHPNFLRASHDCRIPPDFWGSYMEGRIRSRGPTKLAHPISSFSITCIRLACGLTQVSQ